MHRSRPIRCAPFLLLLVGSAGGISACNAVLGIDAAQVDPRLSAATSSSSAGAAGTAGHAGTGNVNGNAGTSAGGSGSGGAPTVGSGGLTGDGGAGSDPDGGTPASMCETYCSEVQTECTGAVAQYRDLDQCLRICSLLPPGSVGGPDENSVACRLKYASKFKYALGGELDNYCREAGPSGDNLCGSKCDAFCSLMMQVCTPSVGDNRFDNLASCLSTCNALPITNIGYSTNDPLVSDGNHVQCRIFHVASGAMLDPEEHCEHAMGHTLCEADGGT
jgi:hypothetical protein